MVEVEILIAALLALVFAAVVWVGVAIRSRAKAPGGEAAGDGLKVLATQVAAMSNQVSEQLSAISGQVLTHSGELSRRADDTSRLFSDLRGDLGELRESSRRISDVGKDISELHRVFVSPKLRGGMGETLLEEILAQSLPRSCYALQHPFSDGSRVDAVVKLSGGIVPVDSKFPLENFRRVAASEDEGERSKAARRFSVDLKRHVDAIAGSYIQPDEGTLGFALMYVPAENVYYEAFLREGELLDYALSKRVVPVSPGGFYAYLQTVLMGLRGMEVSERAEEIIRAIDRLRREYALLTEDFTTLGRHITNARAKYDDTRVRAERFSGRLSSLDASEVPPPPPATPASPSTAPPVITAPRGAETTEND